MGIFDVTTRFLKALKNHKIDRKFYVFLCDTYTKPLVVVVVIVGGTAFIALSLSALSFVPVFKSPMCFRWLRITVLYHQIGRIIPLNWDLHPFDF